jgi:hypothetical protein
VDTAPNAAFSPDPTAVGVNELVSPVILLPAGPAQLNFRNNYNLEASSSSSTVGYDGGVLEIKIGGGAFTDIITAGGSFISGGYNRTLSSSYSNPLAGRSAWSGSSGGFTNTIVNLPAAAAGQSIQLKWRCGSDSSVGLTGWAVDTLKLSTLNCCAGGYAPFITTNPASLTVPQGSPAAFSVAAAGTAPLAYQWQLNGSYLLGAVTNLYAVASAQPTNAGSYRVIVANYYGSVTSAPAILTVTAGPVVAPALSLLSYTNHQFSFFLSGTVGTNYVVQASTNLAGNHWIPLRTNAAPFLFIDSNVDLFLQRFYRGLVAP